VRKILKSRRSERIALDGLQHILDEAVHALRLKKAAVALAGSGGGVSTFADDATLAGDAGEGYLQALDRRAEEALVDLHPAERAEANYRLTSGRRRGARAGLLSDLRRLPAGERRRVLGGRDLEGRGPALEEMAVRAGTHAVRLAPPAGGRARRPRRRSNARS
jgi:hypothetical protein